MNLECVCEKLGRCSALYLSSTPHLYTKSVFHQQFYVNNFYKFFRKMCIINQFYRTRTLILDVVNVQFKSELPRKCLKRLFHNLGLPVIFTLGISGIFIATVCFFSPSRLDKTLKLCDRSVKFVSVLSESNLGIVCKKGAKNIKTTLMVR